MYFRGGSTIKDLLVNPKDRNTIIQESGVIYRYKCGRVDCEVGVWQVICRKNSKNTGRPPTISMTYTTPLVMTYPLDNFSHVGREDQNIARSIAESFLIRVNDPFLNRNIGKYHLSHIWYELLMNSPEHKSNSHITSWLL